ncbi:hypothetical protein ZTR_09133 [Talaromyces verruculosus]|nr:hypothetical protein ZTR_09133 [Talaromyces verruculosus]
MVVLSESAYFLILAVTACFLLWGVSLFNGTVTALIVASWNGRFEDGTPFNTTYTGFFPLDFPISLLVAFFFYAFVWLYAESARLNEKPFSISNPIIWGLMWQAFGAAIALPLYFRAHLKWIDKVGDRISSVDVGSARSLPASFILGALVPAIVGMLPTWYPRPDVLHQNILAAWQPDPVWVSVLQATQVFILFSRARNDGRAVWWTRLSYLLAALSSAAGHIYGMGSILVSTDPATTITKVYVPYLFAGPEGATQKLASGPWLFLQYDLIIISISSTIAGPSLNAILRQGLVVLDRWYGLVAARNYLRVRPNVNLLIIDSDSTVGGVWSEKRLYPNLVAQVNLGLFNYIDTPMSPEGMNDKRQVTGRMIHNYLQKYAEDHDLLRRIRFNTYVERVERGPRGWRLHFRNSADILDAGKLMVGPGVTSIPSMPEYSAEDVQVPIIHSRDLGESFNELQKNEYKHVMVVGAAKSAYDAVYLLLTMGKKVTWVIRPGGSGPLAILPSELLGFWTSIGVASTRLMTGLSPSILNTKGLLYSIFQNNPIGRWLTGRFWDTVAFLSDLHAGYDKGDHVAGLRPEVDGKSIFWANSGLGVVTLPDFWPTIHKGDVTIVRDELQALSNRTMSFKSGKSVESDFIVMCTGWGDHFAMFDDETKSSIGLPANNKKRWGDRDWKSIDREADKTVDQKLPFLAKGPVLLNEQTTKTPSKYWRLYRRVVPIAHAKSGDHSLAILGQIHTVQTPLVASVQTFWAILYLEGELNLPGEDEMAKEIAEWNAWTRKRYISQGQKFPYSLYDFLPYVETLCKDLGLNSRRKSNPLSEYFSPYKPEDFNGIIDEYFAQKGLGSHADKLAAGSHYPSLFTILLAGLGTLLVLANWT